jgi:hypothetical protein
LTEGSVILEAINRAGGNSGACPGQMYNMGTLLRHGSEEQKRKYLPKIATGELRLQSMGVTEPATGTDTTKIKTTAVKKGGRQAVGGDELGRHQARGVAELGKLPGPVVGARAGLHADQARGKEAMNSSSLRVARSGVPIQVCLRH